MLQQPATQERKEKKTLINLPIYRLLIQLDHLEDIRHLNVS